MREAVSLKNNNVKKQTKKKCKDGSSWWHSKSSIDAKINK